MNLERKQKLLKRYHTSKKVKKVTAILLVICVLISSAYAFMTAHQTKDNMFTVGNIRLELHEDGWESNTALTVLEKDGTRYQDGREYINKSKLSNIITGEPITKDPMIKNVGKNPAHVYISVDMPTVYINDTWVDLFDTDYDNSSKWQLFNTKTLDDGRHVYYYYYNEELYPDEETEQLFSTITLKDSVYDKLDLSKEFSVIVNGYGSQITGDPDDDWDNITIPDPYKVEFQVYNLTYLREDSSVFAKEKKYPGDPIEMKFNDTLVKQNFSFDWIEDNGTVAYEGMPMPAEDLTLNASYTQLTSAEPSVGYFIYNVCRDEETDELFAIIYNIDENKFDNSEVVNTPTSISFTCQRKTNTVTDNQEKIIFMDVHSPLNYKMLGTDAFDSLTEGERYENIPIRKTGEFWKDFSSIKEVYLSDGITYVGQIYGRAGEDDDHTEIIHIPYSTTTIYDAFYRTTNLKEIIIPNSCTVAYDLLPSGCAKKVVIPKSVTQFSIGGSGEELILNNDITSSTLGCFNKYIINGNVQVTYGGLKLWYTDPDYLDIETLPEYIEVILNGNYENAEQDDMYSQFAIGMYSFPPVDWPDLHLTVNGTIEKLSFSSYYSNLSSIKLTGTGIIDYLYLSIQFDSLDSSNPPRSKEAALAKYSEFVSEFEGTIVNNKITYY